MKRSPLIRKKPLVRKPFKIRKNGKSEISKLKLKAWTVFSKWIRERDKYTCITCGKYEEGRGMHAGHYISRRHNNTFLDERNVHAQCAGCNLYLSGNIPTYTIKLQEMYGVGIIQELVDKSRIIKQFTKQELLDIIEKYE